MTLNWVFHVRSAKLNCRDFSLLRTILACRMKLCNYSLPGNKMYVLLLGKFPLEKYYPSLDRYISP
jgi:hypothetical protein